MPWLRTGLSRCTQMRNTFLRHQTSVCRYCDHSPLHIDPVSQGLDHSRDRVHHRRILLDPCTHSQGVVTGSDSATTNFFLRRACNMLIMPFVQVKHYQSRGNSTTKQLRHMATYKRTLNANSKQRFRSFLLSKMIAPIRNVPRIPRPTDQELNTSIQASTHFIAVHQTWSCSGGCWYRFACKTRIRDPAS